MSSPVPRRACILCDDADDSATLAAHQEGLRVLRGELRCLWVDGVSDRPWPAQATGPLQALIRLANLEKAGRHEAADSVLYMDVEVDPRNGEQFELVVALSPFTTGAEGLDNSEKLIYSASDTGSGLWMALTPSEHSELREKLLARGVSPDAVIPQ